MWISPQKKIKDINSQEILQPRAWWDEDSDKELDVEEEAIKLEEEFDKEQR